LDKFKFYKGRRTSLDDLNEVQDFFEGSHHTRTSVLVMTLYFSTFKNLAFIATMTVLKDINTAAIAGPRSILG